MPELQLLEHTTTLRREARRTVYNQLAACGRGLQFFDGARTNGYGGLRDDGRWGAVAERLITTYALQPGARVLQVQAEKGFLVAALAQRGVDARGTESSFYAMEHSVCRDRMAFGGLPFQSKDVAKHYDLVLCVGAVYTQSLDGAVDTLRELARVGRRAFVTLCAYDTEQDFWLMRRWSLLGCLLYRREEWGAIMQHAGYAGDYQFVTATTLGLVP